MRQLLGIPVVDGVVIAEALVLDAEKYRLPAQRPTRPGDPADPQRVADERARYREAVEKAKVEVEARAEDLASEAAAAAILMVQRGLLDEEAFHQDVEEQIAAGFGAEQAVSKVVNTKRKQFRQQEFTLRLLPDLDDLEQTLIVQLLGEERETLKDLTAEVIVIARDLTPSQTMSLPLEFVKGFATDKS